MSDSIGVVIPLYNKRDYVLRAVGSVLQQSYADFRLTIVDDGSTDGGGELVAKIADPRARLVRTERHGPGAARNLGMQLTDTDWIGLLDADDEWSPDFLAQTVAVAQSVPAIVAIFTAIQIQGRPPGPRAACAGLIEDYLDAKMRFQAAITSSSVLLRKAPFVEMGGFREEQPYAEDIDAWFRLSCAGPCYFIPEPLSKIELGALGTTGSLPSGERAAGLQMMLDSYEAYRREGRIPPAQTRSSRRFMQQQRARLALHLINAGQGTAGIRALLTRVPPGAHTWREYVRCARALVHGRR